MRLDLIHVRVNEFGNDVTGVKGVELMKIMRIPRGWGTRILVKYLDGVLHYTKYPTTMILKM